MKTPTSAVSRRTFSLLVAPGIVLVAAASLLGSFDVASHGGARISASTSRVDDEDRDGLVYGQELILGTMASVADSDLDGFSDAEELARGTSPLLGIFYPTAQTVHAGITARGEPDGLHALIAVYTPDGNVQDLKIEVGILTGRRMVMLRPSLLLQQGSMDYVPGATPNSIVALLDFRFPRSWVDATGHLTMFAMARHRGQRSNEAAAAMDLFNTGGVVVLAMPDPTTLPSQGISGGPGQQGGGTVYRALTFVDNEPPSGWTMGEVCVQSSQAVMVSGPLVVHEISSADCQGGWEGACPPDCDSSVGSTFTTVDPTVLVGG
jgi:hypothetical protein